MNKNLLLVLIFFMVLVIYLSLQTVIKINALGGFFHPVFKSIIIGLIGMVGKNICSLFMRKGEENK